MARIGHAEGRAGFIDRTAHHVQGHARRVRQHGHPTDLRNVHRRHLQLAARGGPVGHCCVHIRHRHIAQPHRLHACHLGGDLHQPARQAVTGVEQSVVHARLAAVAHRPADHVAIKTRGCIGVPRQQLVPDEIAFRVAHISAPASRSG
jgi:hypothetical protein